MLCPGFVRTRIWESGRNLQTGTPDGIGRFNHFHNIQSGGEGSIYWTPAMAPTRSTERSATSGRVWDGNEAGSGIPSLTISKRPSSLAGQPTPRNGTNIVRSGSACRPSRCPAASRRTPHLAREGHAELGAAGQLGL